MKLRTRIHTVAWLGLIAMWLVVFAPLLSQLLVSAHADAPLGVICSAAAGEPATNRHQVSHDPLSACGYCNLLAHHVPAPAGVFAPQPIRLVLAAAVFAAPPTFVPYTEFPSGRPRDPPLAA